MYSVGLFTFGYKNKMELFSKSRETVQDIEMKKTSKYAPLTYIKFPSVNNVFALRRPTFTFKYHPNFCKKSSNYGSL